MKSAMRLAIIAITSVSMAASSLAQSETENWRLYGARAHTAVQQKLIDEAEANLRKALQDATSSKSLDRSDPEFKLLLSECSSVVWELFMQQKYQQAEVFAKYVLSSVQRLIKSPSAEETACLIDLAMVYGAQEKKAQQSRLLARVEADIATAEAAGRTRLAQAMSDVVKTKQARLTSMVRRTTESIIKQVQDLEKQTQANDQDMRF